MGISWRLVLPTSIYVLVGIIVHWSQKFISQWCCYWTFCCLV